MSELLSNLDVNHSLALRDCTFNTVPPPIPALAPGSLIVSGLELSWPGGAGTPGFRADRHPQAYAQAAPAGRGYRAPAGPARAAAWRIPTPDRHPDGLALGQRRQLRPLGLRAAAAGALAVIAAAKPDRRQPLQQRHALLLRTGFARPRPALGADLVLRRHRQFVDPRHARARGGALRLRRNEGLRASSCGARLGHHRLDEQRRLRRDRPDRHIVARSRRAGGRRRGRGLLERAARGCAAAPLARRCGCAFGALGGACAGCRRAAAG